MTGADLRAEVSATTDVFTITAELPGALVARGSRQPLLLPYRPAESWGPRRPFHDLRPETDPPITRWRRACW
jgi:hypothetical protein